MVNKIHIGTNILDDKVDPDNRQRHAVKIISKGFVLNIVQSYFKIVFVVLFWIVRVIVYLVGQLTFFCCVINRESLADQTKT